jgi:hypothetical protein
MSMRRYVLVRAAWQVGVLFTFVSLAYVVAWVVPKGQLAHDPGYGGFLGDLARRRRLIVVTTAFGNPPLMAGALVAASVLAAGVSFAVDVACAAIDPRFRRF